MKSSKNFNKKYVASLFYRSFATTTTQLKKQGI